MRALLIVPCVLLAVSALAQGGTRQERKMRSLLAKGKPYPAIRIANDMLVAKVPHPEFHVLRAEAYNSIADFSKAEYDAREAMRLFPDSTNGLFQLAMAEQGLGQLDSAAFHLRQVKQRAPSVEVCYRLAIVQRMRGQLPDALLEVDRALVLSKPDGPATARLHRVKGEVDAMMGDTASARIELDKAVDLAPKDPVNYNSRGFYLYALAGDHKRAIADYDRAIKLNPNYSYAFNNRGWSLYKTGETDKGIRDIQRARKKKPFNPYTYRNLGVIALETGDTTRACGLFRQSLERGFTALYGDEVERLITVSCKDRKTSTPAHPAPALQGPADGKGHQQVPRTNAP
jgi:tetratricopeptide (TPR) repeat protein